MGGPARTRAAAPILAISGAILMPVSLFLDWYELREGATGDNARFAMSGWDSLRPLTR